MRIKKVLLVLIALFVLTGCTAKYELTYENDVFSEHIVINEEKINGSLSEFGINRVKTNPNLVKLDEKNSYKYEFTNDEKSETLTLDFKYDNISIDNSLVYKNCFRYKTFLDKDDYYYFHLEGDMVCEYLSSSDIVFKTDKVVLKHNADEVDEEKGIYKWNDFEKGEIVFQVSKTEKIQTTTKTIDDGIIPLYVKIIIAAIVGLIIFVVYRKVKKSQEF